MRNIFPASTIAAALICGSQAIASPQDAIRTGNNQNNSRFDQAIDKGSAFVIKKAVTFVAGKIVGFGVGEMLNSRSLNAGEDAAVRRMNEQWRRQQESRGVPIPARKP